MTRSSFSTEDQCAQAFRKARKAGVPAADARMITVGLLALKLARRKGLLSDDEPMLAGYAACLPGEPLAAFDPEMLDEIALEITPDASDPRILGEVYQRLLETPETENSAHKKNLRESRRHGGVFFTPAAMVREVIALVDPTERDTVCDPSAGAGHFLLGMIRYLREEESCSPAALRRFASKKLFACDRDGAALVVARLALWLELSTPKQAFVPPASQFVQCDTLLGDVPPSPFTVLVGNPPYDVLTRFAKHPEKKEYAQALRASGRYALSLRGQINLYRCFIERGLQLLEGGGRLAFVVPSSLLMDRSAAPLRKALLQEHGADRFRAYGESSRIFDGVAQAVVTFRVTKGRGRSAQVEIAGDDCCARVRHKGLAALGEESPLPVATAADWRLLAWLNTHAPRRFDAIASGFVGEVDQTVYRPMMRDTPTGTLLLRGSHLAAGRVDLTEEPGKERFLAREAFLEKKGGAAACLARVKQMRVAQLGIRNMETRPRLVAAVIPPGIFCGNSVNCWTPREGTSPLLLAGLLNSRLYDWRFCLTSSNNNINLCEVESLPLPEYFDPGAVARIETVMKRCGNNGLDEKKRGDLDAAVFDLFALPKTFRKQLLE